MLHNWRYTTPINSNSKIALFSIFVFHMYLYEYMHCKLSKRIFLFNALWLNSLSSQWRHFTLKFNRHWKQRKCRLFFTVCMSFSGQQESEDCVRGIEKSKHSLRVHKRSAEACLMGGASRAEIHREILLWPGVWKLDFKPVYRARIWKLLRNHKPI